MKIKSVILFFFLFTNISASNKIVGLNNIGNTCFMNATLQCLFSLNKLNNLIIQNIDKYKIDSISKEYIDLLNDYEKQTESFEPQSFCYIVRENFKLNNQIEEDIFQQEDAHEFLSKLLDHLTNEDIENNQILRDNFKNLIYINLITQMQQNEISWTGQTEENTTNIPVPIIGNELVDCLNDFFKKETLENEIQKQYQISFLAEYLIIQLKRFNPDLTKNTTDINFPIKNLNLKNYLSKDIKNKNANYNLIGIIAQSGGDLSSGHYIAYTKRNDKWYKFDDEKINEIKKAPSHNIKENDDYIYMPYILFYKKSKPEQAPEQNIPTQIDNPIHTFPNTSTEEMNNFFDKINLLDSTSYKKEEILKSHIKNFGIPEELKIFNWSLVNWFWQWFGYPALNPWQEIITENNVDTKINESNIDNFLNIAQQFKQYLIDNDQYQENNSSE